LTDATYAVLEEVVFDEVDYVIGLDLMIQETTDSAPEEQMVASYSDGQLVVYKTRKSGGGSEIVINGGLSRQWAMWRADGFYLVKSGGMNQGICSVGLLPTDEALIRLNPAVRVISIKIDAER
jgi:hypothetical protein